jgi:copper chaperone CopZ
MQTLALSIQGMTCNHCVASVREALAAVPGVVVRDVRIGAATVDVAAQDGPTAAAALAAVEEAGYAATVADAPGAAASA